MPTKSRSKSNPEQKRYEERQSLYRQIERQRKSRVIAYATGDRRGMETQISGDVIQIFGDHLDAMFPTKRISLILYTRGGNTLAAWNLVNMIRMFCDELEVIVPATAHSAGTLICLGSDKIVMTKQATLGPIDPSLTGPLNPQIPGAAPDARAPVSVEAVKGYLEMAKADFGIKGPKEMTQILIDLSNKVHPLVLGSIFRTRSQIQFLARQLLKNQVADTQVQKKIIDFLCSESGSHDYTINRREAHDLGLKVEKASQSLYDLLQKFYNSLRLELQLGTHFALDAVLGDAQEIQYDCTRAIIESTAAAGYVFSSRGKASRTKVQTPLGEQDAVKDVRYFDGWRVR